MAQNEAEGYEGFRKAREKFGPTQGRIIDSSGGFWGEREGVVTCGFVNSDDEDEGENKNKPPLEEDSQDSDSDSGEFDYLLDEPLPQHSFETQQIILDNSELTYLQVRVGLESVHVGHAFVTKMISNFIVEKMA